VAKSRLLATLIENRACEQHRVPIPSPFPPVILSEAKNLIDSSSSKFVWTPQNDTTKGSVKNGLRGKVVLAG